MCWLQVPVITWLHYKATKQSLKKKPEHIVHKNLICSKLRTMWHLGVTTTVMVTCRVFKQTTNMQASYSNH